MSDIVLNLLRTKAGRAPGEYVFTKNSRKINDDHATKKLKKYVVDGKLSNGLHFHSLRHYAECRTMPSQDTGFNRMSLFPLVNSA